ncbi:DUF2345 domain-containing protein, partial [Formivibrio citricus]|uniref:DUF2345 domain-containing protein n=1 Tax=Formivibrio citricus TaxID=83765 RepID=UPI00116029A2
VVPGVSAEARDSTVAGNGDFAGNGLMPLAVPFRAKPTALGIQTATVVGPAEEEIHTDSQGRIKVQFHWQRPSEHPEFGANLDDKSSCWLRVAYPSAGVAWGQQFIPRIGQEVLVDFIEGDIDRPVVVGVLYNGSHPTPDFSGAGKLPANKTLSGIKSKEYKGSQYNELLLDDSTGEVRTKLSSEHAKTQLNQGYLIHPRTEGKGEPRGEGFELRTDKHGALRAAHGILLSTEAQNGASGKQLDRVQAQSQLDSAFTLAQSLAEVATHQQADTAETGQDDQTVQSDNSAGPKTKQGHLHHLQHALKSWEAGSNTDKEGQSASQQQTGQQPLIVLSAPAGIVSTTAQAQALTAGTNLDLIAQRDTHQTSGRRWIHNAGQHISLFVQGVKEQISLKLIAARGKIQMQAQDDSIEMNAAKDIKQTANQKVHVMAGEEILLASGGGYIRLRGGDIEVHCPGKISIKGAAHIIDGPERMNVGHPDFPQGSMKTPLTVQLDQSPLGLQLGWARMPYQLFADGALVQQGVLDQSAQLQIAHEVVTQQYLLKLANGVEYQIPVATDYTNPEQGELANKGFHKHLAGAAPEGGATEASAVARTDHYQTLTGKLAEGEQA